MKKHLSLLLSALLVAALLAGCGRVASDGDTPEGAASSTADEAGATSSSAAPPEEDAASSSGAAPEVEDAPSSSGVAPEVEDAPSSGDASSEPEAGDASSGETSPETEPWLTIDSRDAYDAAYTFTVPEDGSYSFTVSNAAGQTVTWEVYVLEEPFEDATRYIPQAYEPCLTGSGTLTLTAGGQVYCICSVNAFTGDPLEAGSSQLLVSRTAAEVSAGTFSQGTNDSTDASGSALVITSEDAFDGCYAFEAEASGTYLYHRKRGGQ